MIFAGNDYNRRNCPAIRANGLNNRNPFPIALLKPFSFPTSFCAYYDHIGGNFAYYKPNFVEIVDIFVVYTVFSNRIRNKAKSAPNNIWIVA
jgi:hypothetical protein